MSENFFLAFGQLVWRLGFCNSSIFRTSHTLNIRLCAAGTKDQCAGIIITEGMVIVVVQSENVNQMKLRKIFFAPLISLIIYVSEWYYLEVRLRWYYMMIFPCRLRSIKWKEQDSGRYELNDEGVTKKPAETVFTHAYTHLHLYMPLFICIRPRSKYSRSLHTCWCTHTRAQTKER